jgi:hypothetical protein
MIGKLDVLRNIFNFNKILNNNKLSAMKEYFNVLH